MLTAYATNAYKREGVMTSTPVDLIIALYDGLIKQYKIACLMIEDKALDKANTSLIKAGDILSELIKSLDLKIEIARDLLSLYDFLYNSTVQANFDKDTELIHELLGMVSELREAWVGVKSQTTVMAIGEQ